MRLGYRVTPDVLFFLFADRVVPKGRPFTNGVLPNRAKAHALSCSALLFAAAFWSPKEQGLVGLEVLPTKKPFSFFVPVTELRAALLREPYALRGLEGALAHLLGDAENGDTVENVIQRWFGDRRHRPDAYVTEAVAQDAAASGYLDEQDTGGVVGRFVLGGRLVPDPEEIAGLEEGFEEAFSRWQRFRTNEKALYEKLLAECYAGVRYF